MSEASFSELAVLFAFWFGFFLLPLFPTNVFLLSPLYFGVVSFLSDIFFFSHLHFGVASCPIGGLFFLVPCRLLGSMVSRCDGGGGGWKN
jgi:hypothetical protein